MGCFETCTKPANRPIITVKEGQRFAFFLNEEKCEITLTKFDGCVECEGRRADFVVNHPDRRRVIVELKGRDVEGCEEQIKNTFKHLRSKDLAEGPVAALVVCSKVPLGVSSVQRLAGNLKAAGVAKLKVKSREWKGRFDELF
jgi:hypothetical protein